MNVKEVEPRKPKANFIKVDIDIKDQPIVSFWAGMFTILPFPLIFVKAFSGIIADKLSKYSDYEITKEQLLNILNASHGLVVNVEAKDANIDIKIL